MIKFLTYTLAILLLYVIATLIGYVFRIFGSGPDLFLIFVIAITVFRDNLEFIPVALFSGLLVDLSSGFHPGFITVIFLILSLLLHAIYHRVTFYEFNWKHAPLILIIAFATVRLWLYFIFFIIERFLENSFILDTLSLDIKKGMFALIYTLAFTYPVFLFARVITEFLSVRDLSKKNLF